mmetsp:Transcript_64773/g.148319  ORF Transcript_64773/g.148319 Transcript_64773/m.148319 type:complete len:305 (+) Transcript_64773:73-987(+)
MLCGRHSRFTYASKVDPLKGTSPRTPRDLGKRRGGARPPLGARGCACARTRTLLAPHTHTHTHTHTCARACSRPKRGHLVAAAMRGGAAGARGEARSPTKMSGTNHSRAWREAREDLGSGGFRRRVPEEAGCLVAAAAAATLLVATAATTTLVAAAAATLVAAAAATVAAIATAAAAAARLGRAALEARGLGREHVGRATRARPVTRPGVAAAAAATIAAAAAAAVAAAAARLLLGATGHLIGAVLATALVPGLGVLDLAALDEAPPVGDGGEVAEDILAAVVRLDESEPLLVPPERDASLLAP